uniref:peptidylprolyl isomerase n=1 Tax=Hemiselmis tepida TaxID=464990 RepID=A0A7S0VUH9_9CRYP|mmetsp:Transcript_28667/g.72623  ORF Transcript_28667/g.72623 Transcript_28667/m.72623 type:complete len:183 (+) Transcript_28667:40-588(+)
MPSASPTIAAALLLAFAAVFAHAFAPAVPLARHKTSLPPQRGAASHHLPLSPVSRSPGPRNAASSLSMASLERTVLREGDGKTFPQPGDTVTCHYEGRLARGNTLFDSSYDYGEPISFQIGEGQVIKGWDQGILDMSLGEKCKLDVPPFYGYGPRGDPPDIPPMSPLVFEIELLQINDQKAA